MGAEDITLSQSVETEHVSTDLDKHLVRMIEMRASDLFLRAGSPPAYRVDGRIVRTDLPAPDSKQMRGYLDHVLTPIAHERFRKSPDLDISYTIGGKGRFRVNVFLYRGNLGIIARLIPLGGVEFGELNLPDAVLKMADKRSGMILVVGPTGCGKSTTLAALIHHINLTREAHIVTIEDPIEFVHEERRCIIHQRQVGYDTESFATALRHVVRQSPDVILIGEMRDQDTMQTALSAALTGHLILTTLHTTNVAQSIDRMLNYFPPEARGQAQADLAVTMVGIVSMRLLPRADGHGRVPAVEVLRATPLVRRLVAEGDLAQLYDVMKRGGDSGMITANQSLVDLCKSGAVDESVALRYAPNPDEFRLNMQGMFTGIDSIDLRTEDRSGEEDEK
ncbi:MAG: PilT/PilU family type 4a pilus ATPase [Planctomycetes bacterium]|nr:PilT/PilU family type 4a pilus ATPase [Planctomycetota bacterium]